MHSEGPIKVYVFRSVDVDESTLRGVMHYLRQFPGIMQFEELAFKPQFGRFLPLTLSNKRVAQRADDFSGRLRKTSVFFQPFNEEPWSNEPSASENATSVDEAFRECRVAFRLKPDDHLFLLSGKPNDQHFHTMIDLEHNYNCFISTSEWQALSFTDHVYPIVYQLVTAVLKQYMFDSREEAEAASHLRPIGCLMDRGTQRKDVSIKMRTADVCRDCQQRIHAKGVSGALCLQAFRIMESIRGHLLFRERYFLTRSEPHLVVDVSRRSLSIPELGPVPVVLNPLEFVLYQFFLRHPEGVKLNYLQDHTDAILADYLNMKVSGGLEAARARIQDLVNPNSNSASEKISRIKKKLQLNFGSDIAEPLCISGGHSEPKRIRLNRRNISVC